MKPIRPEDLFRAEKERAQSDRNSQHARLLAEAKAAFDKLMAEGQAARKSGRPRKHPLPPLKTTSSRPPVKPFPPTILKAAPPPPAAPAPAVKAAKAAKPSKPAKPPKPAKAAPGAKRVGKKAPKPAKAKPKGKPSKKR